MTNKTKNDLDQEKINNWMNSREEASMTDEQMDQMIEEAKKLEQDSKKKESQGSSEEASLSDIERAAKAELNAKKASRDFFSKKD